MRSWNRVREDREGYLRRIMYNLAVDDWRRRKRRPEVLVTEERAGPADPGSAVALRQTLVAALAQLPPRQRAVLVPRYWEQRSEAETAEMLGCSIGSVKSTASRGLARLRDLTANWEAFPVSNGAL